MAFNSNDDSERATGKTCKEKLERSVFRQEWRAITQSDPYVEDNMAHHWVDRDQYTVNNQREADYSSCIQQGMSNMSLHTRLLSEVVEVDFWPFEVSRQPRF